jgi:hypothetical protein
MNSSQPYQMQVSDEDMARLREQMMEQMRQPEGVEDLSGEIEPGVVESGKTSQADLAAARAPQGGGKLEKAGQLTTAAGAASANPYVAGAGIAMQGIGMIDSGKRQDEQAKIDAYNRKVMAERAAIRNFFA